MIPGWAKNAFSPSNVALEFYSLSQESVPNNKLVLVVTPAEHLSDVFRPVIATCTTFR